MTSINSDQMSSMVLASLNKSNSEMKVAMETFQLVKELTQQVMTLQVFQYHQIKSTS